jgi:hypothetical protein
MAVGPVTNTDLICPQARETNRFPAAVFMLALQCVLLLTAFRSILDSDSTTDRERERERESLGSGLGLGFETT